MEKCVYHTYYYKCSASYYWYANGPVTHSLMSFRKTAFFRPSGLDWCTFHGSIITRLTAPPSSANRRQADTFALRTMKLFFCSLIKQGCNSRLSRCSDWISQCVAGVPTSSGGKSHEASRGNGRGEMKPPVTIRKVHSLCGEINHVVMDPISQATFNNILD